tara:strand:+ start:521 stop:763 length:243 start_codon:yes stop_codon:yes gene_type:complete
MSHYLPEREKDMSPFDSKLREKTKDLIVELENVAVAASKRRPFRPYNDTNEKKEFYRRGFEDALAEVQWLIDNPKDKEKI